MENISFTIPSRDYGGEGESLHFLHANGYPPACYLPFLNHLKTRYQVFGMYLRPLWEGYHPEDLVDWQPLTDDLIHYLNKQNKGRVIAVGHSLGAIVSLRSAIQSPKIFRALILIDPVLFPPLFISGWRLIRYLGLGHKLHPLIPKAQKRRRYFDDLDILFSAYRRRDIFRYINDDNLWILINGIIKPAPGSGFELVYSPEWEVQIYYTGVFSDADIWRELPKFKLPLLIIRGAETDTFFPSTAARIQKILPSTQVVTINNSTHLVPLEKPDEVSDLIFDFLEKIP
jgi:pimeloyl-ACP methyl ester carboxylesterase